MGGFQRWLVAAAAAAVMAAAPAGAATVNVTMQGKTAFQDGAGHNAWYQSASYSLNGVNRTAAAGLFRLTATGANGTVQDFLAFCLEPLETLTLPRDHSVGSGLSAPILDRLAALMGNGIALVTGATSAAAFQLAAWEIANEGSGTLDLSRGAFRVTSASGAARSLAQSWLDGIATGAWASAGPVTILSAPGTQDLVTDIAPVPVPAAGILLIGGIGALAAFGRRRRG